MKEKIRTAIIVTLVVLGSMLLFFYMFGSGERRYMYVRYINDTDNSVDFVFSVESRRGIMQIPASITLGPHSTIVAGSVYFHGYEYKSKVTVLEGKKVQSVDFDLEPFITRYKAFDDRDPVTFDYEANHQLEMTRPSKADRAAR